MERFGAFFWQEAFLELFIGRGAFKDCIVTDLFHKKKTISKTICCVNFEKMAHSGTFQGFHKKSFFIRFFTQKLLSFGPNLLW